MYLLLYLNSIMVIVNFTEKVDGRSKSRSISDDRPKSRVVDFRRPTANTNIQQRYFKSLTIGVSRSVYKSNKKYWKLF